MKKISGVITLFCVLVFALTFTACSSKTASRKTLNNEETTYYGHRGYPAKYFENTIESFEATGKEESYAGIETDLWLTKDNQYVVVHDSNPFNETDKSVPELTLDEVKQYTIHASTNYPWFHEGVYHVPTLKEYLDICKKYNKIALLEIKHDNLTKAQLEEIIDILDKAGMDHKAKFISFNDDEIQVLREILPDYIEIMQLVDTSEETTNKPVMDYINDGIAVDVGDPKSDFSWPWSSEITQEMIDKSHEKGLHFGVWGVDTKERAEELSNMGVDYITTDFIKADSTGFNRIHNEVDGKYLIDDKGDKKEEPEPGFIFYNK